MQQLELFLSDEKNYAISNYIARSPIFASIKRGKRRQLNDELVLDAFGVEIKQSGKQLDMADQDVFLSLIRLGKSNHLGKVYFSRYKFIHNLNRTRSKATYEWLNNAFKRLTEATIYIRRKGTRDWAQIHLIDSVSYDDKKEQYFVRIGEEILKLYRDGQYGLIDWQQRLTLNSFAKWLQCFCLSHKQGLNAFKIGTIQYAAGKTTTKPARFIETLTAAADELVSIGFLFRYQFYKNQQSETLFEWIR